jgi:hypothetical protein
MILPLLVAMHLATGGSAAAEDLTLRIPPVKTSWSIDHQPLTIVASGTITQVSASGRAAVFRVALDADLADLQRQITPLLKSQLDRSQTCGERIAIEHATLVPQPPASLLTVHLHYERWACAKAFGKQVAKRLAGGNGVVPVKLTPEVEQNSVRLAPQVGNIEADGSLGELLRSGSLGATLREKVSAAIVSAVQKGANLNASLPPAVESVATLRSARFRDAGAGNLGLTLEGEARLSEEQVRMLMGK